MLEEEGWPGEKEVLEKVEVMLGEAEQEEVRGMVKGPGLVNSTQELTSRGGRGLRPQISEPR